MIKQLKSFAAELGIFSTTLVNMVAKQAIRERRVKLKKLPKVFGQDKWQVVPDLLI
jgi:hypothetical protein